MWGRDTQKNSKSIFNFLLNLQPEYIFPKQNLKLLHIIMINITFSQEKAGRTLVILPLCSPGKPDLLSKVKGTKSCESQSNILVPTYFWVFCFFFNSKEVIRKGFHSKFLKPVLKKCCYRSSVQDHVNLSSNKFARMEVWKHYYSFKNMQLM